MLKHLFLCALTFVLCASFVAPPVFSQEAGLTPKNPLTVDMRERSVSVLAQVNGKYLVQPPAMAWFSGKVKTVARRSSPRLPIRRRFMKAS